jgi:rhodanese-related sulfurtransferase
MRFSILPILLLLVVSLGLGQKNLERALKIYNKGSVPYIMVKELHPDESLLLLDTRQKEEYEVSHLRNAEWIGHRDFNAEAFVQKYPDKKQPIVVYCSIGVRSENIGEKLLKLGYGDVQNLYGGIFSWKNEGLTIYNRQGIPTDSIHAFNKHWGKFLENGTKVYAAPKK